MNLKCKHPSNLCRLHLTKLAAVQNVNFKESQVLEYVILEINNNKENVVYNVVSHL